MSLLWILALLIAAITRGNVGLSVNQMEKSVVVTQGDPIILNCTYESQSSVYTFWYIQYPRQYPRLFLRELGPLDSDEGVLRGFKDKHDQPNSFSIQKNTSQLNDSAVYFCAVSDPGNADKVLFGSGTELKVTPNLPPSEPFVYELKPHDESKSLSACLFADYSPDNIEVSVGGEPKDTNSSVVVVGSEASYGAVRWTKNTGNLNCTATYDGKKFFANNNATADVCSGTPMSFQTDERLNLLSLTVLGLRIIFLKSVAVNLLLTFRLWYIKN